LIEEEFSPAGYNIGFNVGAVAGQTVMHCHCHVIPQYAGDVKEPQRFSQTRPFQLPTAALQSAILKKEAYGATLKCHDANGELYMPPFRSLSRFFMYYYRKNRGTMF